VAGPVVARGAVRIDGTSTSCSTGCVDDGDVADIVKHAISATTIAENAIMLRLAFG